MGVLENLKKALKNLNGQGALKEIYSEYEKIAGQVVESTIRRTLQQYSSDSNVFLQKEDLFFSVAGIGKGVWGLRNFIVQEDDYVEVLKDRSSDPHPPERSQQISTRILRNTALALQLKRLTNYQCQLCETRLEVGKGKYYAEAHHIQPLGTPHNGPDIKENILVLCPNCHVLCDHATFEIQLEMIKHNIQGIDPIYLEYHNKRFKELRQ